MTEPGAESYRVLEAIVQAAVDVTGAADGWLVARAGGQNRVVAAVGPAAAAHVGAEVPAGSGTTGFVLASGQPIALSADSDDPRLSHGVSALMGRNPASVLCVPCLDKDVITGALELVDKPGTSPFTFDDVEFATVLGQVAGVALSTSLSVAPSVPNPSDLSSELHNLSATDPARYSAVATALAALLSRD